MLHYNKTVYWLYNKYLNFTFKTICDCLFDGDRERYVYQVILKPSPNFQNNQSKKKNS